MEPFLEEWEALNNRQKVILDKIKEEQFNEEPSNSKKRKLRSVTENEHLHSRIEWLHERYEWQEKNNERLRKQNKLLCAEKSEKFNAVKQNLEQRFGDAFRQRNEAIRERDDLRCERDDALDTTCSICLESGCFVGRICGNNCRIKCCINCFVEMGKNRHSRCPGCRGDFANRAIIENRVLHQKLRTPVYMSRVTTPRNVVQNSLRMVMEGQMPELTSAQISRRLDDLFAETEAPLLTVTDLFESALPPAPATPAANVSGSNSFVINGTTYFTD